MPVMLRPDPISFLSSVGLCDQWAKEEVFPGFAERDRKGLFRLRRDLG
jgi:hypothetical protein